MGSESEDSENTEEEWCKAFEAWVACNLSIYEVLEDALAMQHWEVVTRGLVSVSEARLWLCVELLFQEAAERLSLLSRREIYMGKTALLASEFSRHLAYIENPPPPPAPLRPAATTLLILATAANMLCALAVWWG